MNIKALFVDLNSSDLVTTWKSQLAEQKLAIDIACVDSQNDANNALTETTVVPMVIFAEELSQTVLDLLRQYQLLFGPISEFQAVVCSDPSPMYMAAVFEFGVEQFIAKDTWPTEVAALLRSCKEKIGNEASPEFKTLALSTAVRTADTDKIKEAKEAMGDLATYDFRAAYASGKASEASGNYDEAIDAYRSAGGMNKMFRPTSSSLGEAYLITGKVDDAIAIFQKLEKSNPNDLDRKSNLASAFIEKGEFATAEKYAKEAEVIAPGSSRLAEIKAQVLLAQGKVGDAFALMDQMSDVGPFFAAKLNDLGIKLSQAGKGKSALALYQKAHKIVRPDLRYKISLNAALACRRLQDYDLALKYVVRCAQEYGSLFPKLAKIRETLLKEKSENVLNGGDGNSEDKAS